MHICLHIQESNATILMSVLEHKNYSFIHVYYCILVNIDIPFRRDLRNTISGS